MDAGHAGDGALDALTFTDEHGVDEVGRGKGGFRGQPAQAGVHAEASQAGVHWVEFAQGRRENSGVVEEENRGMELSGLTELPGSQVAGDYEN